MQIQHFISVISDSCFGLIRIFFNLLKCFIKIGLKANAFNDQFYDHMCIIRHESSQLKKILLNEINGKSKIYDNIILYQYLKPY